MRSATAGRLAFESSSSPAITRFDTWLPPYFEVESSILLHK